MLANSLGRALAVSRCLRSIQSTSALPSNRFSTSSTLFLPRRGNDVPSASDAQSRRRTVSVIEDDMEDVWDQLEEPGEVEDSPSGGHLMLEAQRETLKYMRLIEHEMPKLVAYRKPFVPPTDDEPVIMRSMHYQGEPHPASIKRVIVVPVAKLPLKDEAATHKFQLLAGARWTPLPPADAGLPRDQPLDHGFIKISCEDFPTPSQNLKWASDTLDKLIDEANNGKDSFADIPLDLRHILAKVKKQKKGDHVGNRVFERPSIRDFPQEWLPKLDKDVWRKV